MILGKMLKMLLKPRAARDYEAKELVIYEWINLSEYSDKKWKSIVLNIFFVIFPLRH